MFFEKIRKQMKSVLIVVVIAFAGSLLYFGGVSIWGGSGSSQQAAAAIAEVNGQPITYQAFQEAYLNLVNQQQLRGEVITGSMIESLQYSALDNLINQALLFQEADNRKITVSKERLDKEFEEFKGMFSSEESFKSELQAAGLTEKQLRDLLKESVRIDVMREGIVGDVTVSDEEIADAYREAEVRHILIAPEDDSEEAKEQALKEAKDLAAKLRKGAKFEDLAKEHSDDPGSAQEGGSVGTVTMDSPLVEEFKKVAFSLPVGEVSDPVETEFGYHIIKVDSRKEPVGEEFEAAKEDLKKEILASKQNQKAAEWFEEVRKNAEIVINDSQLQAHRLVREGRTDEAIEAYKKAISENPENGYLYKSLADLYAQKDDVDGALENMKLAASKLETDAMLHYQLGKLYLEKDMKDEAVEAFKNASKYDPNNYMLHAVLASEYQKLGLTELVEEENAKFQEIIQRLQEQQKERETQTEQSPEGTDTDGSTERDSTESDNNEADAK